MEKFDEDSIYFLKYYSPSHIFLKIHNPFLIVIHYQYYLPMILLELVSKCGGGCFIQWFSQHFKEYKKYYDTQLPNDGGK